MFSKNRIYKWLPTISENDSNTNNQEKNIKIITEYHHILEQSLKKVEQSNTHANGVERERQLFLWVETNKTTMVKIYIDSSKSRNRIVMNAA